MRHVSPSWPESSSMHSPIAAMPCAIETLLFVKTTFYTAWLSAHSSGVTFVEVPDDQRPLARGPSPRVTGQQPLGGRIPNGIHQKNPVHHRLGRRNCRVGIPRNRPPDA